MKTIIFILFSLGALILNLDTSKDLSTSSPLILFVEYVFTLCISKIIITNLLKAYSIRTQQKFFVFFVMSLFISLLLLTFAWTPFLSITNTNWGFDPQRYYYYASQIIEKGNYTLGLNYTGVVYFYVLVMKILGVDPLVPLFVNSLLTLTAVLLIVKNVPFEKQTSIENFAFLLLIPEIIYFNIMPSREILCMAMIVFIIVSFVKYFKDRKKLLLFILLFEFLFLFLIRPPFAFSAFLSIFIFLLFFSQRKMGLLTILILVLFTVIVGGQLSSTLGSVNDASSMQESITNKIDGRNEQNTNFNYNENSLAAKLIPNNAIEFVIFGVVRSFVYLFPSPSTFLSLLYMKSAYDLGDVLVNITSLMMMFLIPIIYVGLKKIRKENNIVQMIGITFLVFWIIIGAFNTNMIHVRYRVVYDVLYFSLVIYFISITNKKKIKRLIIHWSGVLLLIIFLFFVLKRSI